MFANFWQEIIILTNTIICFFFLLVFLLTFSKDRTLLCLFEVLAHLPFSPAFILHPPNPPNFFKIFYFFFPVKNIWTLENRNSVALYLSSCISVALYLICPMHANNSCSNCIVFSKFLHIFHLKILPERHLFPKFIWISLI